MSRPKDIAELIDRVGDAFDELEKDPRKMPWAKEMGNLAGKMIAGSALLVEVARLRGEEPHDRFLGTPSGKQLKPAQRLLEEGRK